MVKRNMRKGVEKHRGKESFFGKKGQITIFIIIAILIVSAIIVFLLWVKPTYFAAEGKKIGFEGCVEDAVNEEMKALGEQAGFINPGFYYLYQGQKVGYLCYVNEYYKPCVMQKPLLKNHFEEQLKKAINARVKLCYDNSLNELRKEGYDVVSGNINFDISLEPGRIEVEIEAPTTISRETSQSIRKLNVNLQNPIYNILMIATSILQYETSYGDSDTSTLMMLYPNLIIDKLKRDDGTTIYSIEDKQTQIKFVFATRSYAWPAGYGFE